MINKTYSIPLNKEFDCSPFTKFNDFCTSIWFAFTCFDIEFFWFIRNILEEKKKNTALRFTWKPVEFYQL